MGTPKSPQEQTLLEQIEAIVPGGFEKLHELDRFAPTDAKEVVRLIVQFACASQHVGGIQAGRNAFSKLPQEWAARTLQEVIGKSLNLEDAWEYRRLLELLQHVGFRILREFVEVGLKSKNPEVREAATDFSSPSA